MKMMVVEWRHAEVAAVHLLPPHQALVLELRAMLPRMHLASQLLLES